MTLQASKWGLGQTLILSGLLLLTVQGRLHQQFLEQKPELRTGVSHMVVHSTSQENVLLLGLCDKTGYHNYIFFPFPFHYSSYATFYNERHFKFYK